jgi:hypothetical protein
VVLHTDKLRGSLGRPITVRTNDPARPIVMFTVRANVLASVEVYPFESVHLSNRGASLARSTLLIKKDATESGELKIASPQASVPWITVRSEKLTGERPGTTGMPTGKPGDWVVEAAIGDAPGYGRHTAELVLDTGLGREPVVRIPVTVDVLPPVTLSQESLLIPWPATDPAAARGTVHAQLRQGLDPTRLQAEGDPPSLAVELERAGPRGFKIAARWTESRTPEGAVVLRIGSESVRIPVVAGPGAGQ